MESFEVSEFELTHTCSCMFQSLKQLVYDEELYCSALQHILMVQNVDALRALQFNFLKMNGPDNNKSNRIAKKGKR